MIRLSLKSKLFQVIIRRGIALSNKFQSLYPLKGDRCIEYAFVIKNLVNLDKNIYKTVIDVGCHASPLTTIIREVGFTVDGIDLLPSPVLYEGVEYMHGDFLSMDLKKSYDIVVLCSAIEHIGLEGRFRSSNIKDGDIKTLKKVKQLLNPNGILILTIPYGKEKTIRPLHRVYNKTSRLLKYAYDSFEVEVEEFYKNNPENIWVKCEEIEAKRVIPSENNYALGLFVFLKKEKQGSGGY